jgi:hypothetical protein
MIVFVYEGQLYPEDAVDVDPKTGQPEVDGYEKYEIADTITLQASDVLEGYGQILQILLNTRQAKKL